MLKVFIYDGWSSFLKTSHHKNMKKILLAIFSRTDLISQYDGSRQPIKNYLVNLFPFSYVNYTSPINVNELEEVPP